MVRRSLVGLVAVGLITAGPALASPEVEKELAEMRALVEDLKDKVDAQEEQLEHQGGMLEDAQRVVQAQQEEGLKSSLSEFWQAIDVNMSVAGSYAWNFSNPDLGSFPGIGANSGQNGAFYPFHSDHNSFQVDQVYIDIGKAPTEESRGGFMFSLLYGNTAAFLGQAGNFGAGTTVSSPACPGCPAGTADLDGDGIFDVVLSGGGASGTSFSLAAPAGRRAFGDSTSDYYVHQAYVSYLAPIGEGVQVDVGKFATIIGAEVADTSQNWNITMGNIYNLFQPIDHVGALATTSMGPVTVKGGVVNAGSLANGSPDINKEKSYLGSIGFGDDMVSATVSVLYGAEGGLGIHPSASLRQNNKREGLVDLVTTFETDGFSAWVNANYLWAEENSAQAWGVAVAGMVPITDMISAAARLEYARDDGTIPVFGFGAAGPFTNPRHSEIYGATGTLAFALAENLTLRAEARYDRVVTDTGVFTGGSAPSAGTEEFFTNTGKGSKDQVVGLAQVVYAF